MKTLKTVLLVAIMLPVCTYGWQGGSPAPPNNPGLSRAEFVAMISDYFKWVHWSEYNDYAKSVPRQFSDVKLGDRYIKQIECALEERIVGPDENDRFYPNRPITRQDAAVIFARAFRIPSSSSDALSAFSDSKSVSAAAREALNAMLAAGYMTGATAQEFKPAATLQRVDATEILKKITSTQVSPVQVMPKDGTTSYRRYVNMTCPTPGATIYYSITGDGTEPADPATAGKAYDVAKGFLLFDNPLNSKTDRKYYTLKAVAKKDGLAVGPVRTFVYYIYRPLAAPFQARLVHAPTSTSPAVWDIMNPSDYNRPHCYYIEGSKRGILMDQGQYPYDKANMKTFVDALATKPYDALLGHNNPDHVEQIYNFVQGGIQLYMTPQDKGSVLAAKRAEFIEAAKASVPIHDGDVLDLGNVQMTAYQTPGHSNGLVILQDKKNGWIFGSDMFGCNRPATADLTNYSGAKMDLFLSLVQQLYWNLTKDGGRVEEVYNAHNEVPVGYAGIKNFEKAVQQLIDIGDSASAPSMRGNDNSGKPRPSPQRMSVFGDIWRDKNWAGIWPGGDYGQPVNYLTSANPNYACNNKIDYNAPDGIKKYSVLSSIEINGGDLVGVDVTWAPPSNGVPNTLPNKFDPWTYAYDINVPAANKSITVTPKAMSDKITSMKLNGSIIRTGTSKSISVADGPRIKIDIVAPDGITTSNYVFTIRTY